MSFRSPCPSGAGSTAGPRRRALANRARRYRDPRLTLIREGDLDSAVDWVTHEPGDWVSPPMTPNCTARSAAGCATPDMAGAMRDHRSALMAAHLGISQDSSTGAPMGNQVRLQNPMTAFVAFADALAQNNRSRLLPLCPCPGPLPPDAPVTHPPDISNPDGQPGRTFVRALAGALAGGRWRFGGGSGRDGAYEGLKLKLYCGIPCLA